jgi:hypothetical protein
MSCFKRGFVFVSFFDMYVVVSLTDVKLGEYDGSTKIANEISDEW